MEEELNMSSDAANVDLYEGDVFIDANSTINCAILSISERVDNERFMRVRLYGSLQEHIDISESIFKNYLFENGLKKLSSYRDMIVEVSKKIVLEQGQIYTSNGGFLIEILSDEMLYIQTSGEMKAIVGCKTVDNVVAYRDALEIKSIIYSKSDQFSNI